MQSIESLYIKRSRLVSNNNQGHQLLLYPSIYELQQPNEKVQSISIV